MRSGEGLKELVRWKLLLSHLREIQPATRQSREYHEAFRDLYRRMEKANDETFMKERNARAYL